jgi:serine phosphatase RsbU (regulator of sigma subunit)
MPKSSVVIFLAGVACLFAGVGTVTDSFGLEHSTTARLVATIIVTALTSMMWAFIGSMRMFKWLIVVGVVQVGAFFLLAQVFPPVDQVLSTQQWRDAIATHGLITLCSIITGYVLFVLFFRQEGKRFFAAHTEIELASGIQRQLVPPVAKTIDGFEFYGISIPSGAVGGDLLDVVEAGGITCAYVADVAGHGVHAGVLMSMIKTAVRMRIASTSTGCEHLLESVNEVLTPLTDSRSYATFAYVLITPERDLTYSIAAHLPLFHFQGRNATLERCSVENFPVGMFPVVKYATGRLQCQTGDVIAIVTDGLTEIFNHAGEEIGYTHIEAALTEGAGRPLAEMADRILAASASFGKITDDRTLLLIRRL